MAREKHSLYRVLSQPASEGKCERRRGRDFPGETRVTSDLHGKVTFAFETSQPVSAGVEIPATGNDASGNTSEFSEPVCFYTD